MVCVGPGQKPQRKVFSQRSSNEPCDENVMSFGSNKGADQPAHLFCLISTVIACYLDSFRHIIRKPAFSICKNKGADQLSGNCAADRSGTCNCAADLHR